MKPISPAATDATLDIEAAAALLHLGVASMRELIDTGAVPACQLNRKHTVLLRDDLITYVREEGRRQAESRRAARRKVVPRAAHAARRAALPDLSRYEITTADPPASSRAGSHTSPASPSSDAL